jgi:hypothetical protein
MKIMSLEPTPSPNTMKLNLDVTLPKGKSLNFTVDQKKDAPDELRQILEVDGVKSVYQVLDFIAVERYSKADWRTILTRIQEMYGDAGSAVDAFLEDDSGGDSYGEVTVYIQLFRGIPMQIKLTTPKQEKRYGLPDRFKAAAMKAQTSSSNLVMERQWVDQGVRYGEMDDIGEEVALEIAATYSQERLNTLVEQAYKQGEQGGEVVHEPTSVRDTNELMDAADWETRFAALERMDPTLEDLPVLAKALRDDNQSIRRLATMYLGMIGKPEVLPYLYEALQDKSVSIRRTAGDALSDIGDPAAIGPMAQALSDPNKLVRWRAARFLFEVGDETAVDALHDAVDDPEFEVSLQVKMALERIERGEEASGTVWQQMARRRDEERQSKDS